MKTKSVVGVVLSFALMFALLSGSGVGATIFGQESPENEGLDQFQETVEENEEPTFSVVNAIADVPLIGVILDFGEIATTFVGAVALLPLYLMDLGFPRYFAAPVGTLAQLIAVIGMFQVVTGREFL